MKKALFSQVTQLGPKFRLIKILRDMKKSEKILFIMDELERLYPKTPVPLDHTDAYTLLIAVLLSAQCTDKRVNTVTPKLFKLASTPEDMMMQEVKQIREIIKPCGLSPRKSDAIHRLSKILVDKHSGKVPKSFEHLEELPGVGHKTASVVMAQAFGVPSFPVDTHIHRLAQQWQLTNGKNVVQTEKDLKRAFPEESWNRLHLQIIFYGREYCTARQCDGLHCQLCSKMFPNRKRKRDYKKA